MTSNKKVEENRLPLKLDFTYWKVDCRLVECTWKRIMNLFDICIYIVCASK